MAVAATTLVAEQYRLVDDLPEVAGARREVRIGAVALLDSRRQQAEAGKEADWLPVDALSTAHKALEAEWTYGPGSAEFHEKFSGLVQDSQRLLAEWYRKKKPEYFPPLRQEFREDSEEFFSHGLSITQMTTNALVPIPGSIEDEKRRINERVEEATPHLLRKLGKIAVGTEVVRTVSECTDIAIADYEQDQANDSPHRGYSGYVPEIKKVMIRDIRLDSDSKDRFEEQIALPGIYITHEIIKTALARRGLDVEGLDKTELHGSQMIADDDLLDFAELLDKVASEEWCTDIFMGEKVTPDHAKNYATFRVEALERQEGLKDMARATANFVLDLARDNFDRRKAPAHVESFVKKQLLELGKQDAIVAEQMFDKETAQNLQVVVQLESQGRYQESFELMQAVEKAAPGGGSCGGGSCGLESVNLKDESGKKLRENLKAEDGDTVVRDKERACKCGKKEIVYAYNKNKVNKYCESCHAFESKKTG